MTPLAPLHALSSIARCLMSASPEEAQSALTLLRAEPQSALVMAATRFAEGSLALRQGALVDAERALVEASALFADEGQSEASELASTEAELARIRRGPRAVYGEARERLEALRDHTTSSRVAAVAAHYAGTAARFAGDALSAQRLLLDAFARSDGLLAERAQILNSLGTLYVVLGAVGAAEALLEHAAELHQRTGDRVGEAISHGQIGAAALARGDRARAKRALQRQEWLASQVGDAFGQARALVWLADLALESGRPDDAVLLATQARAIAERTSPPITLWLAYAARALARGKAELGDASAAAAADEAAAQFAILAHPLGTALTAWDKARGMVGAPTISEPAAWFEPAYRLAALGLPARVAELLEDHRERLGDAGARPEVLAAAAQAFPQRLVPLEVSLVYEDPEALTRIAERRVAAARNLARLAALTLAPPGLFAAAFVAPGGAAQHGLPTARSAAAAVGQLGEIAVWVWPASTDRAELVRDLASLRAGSGEAFRARLVFAPEARVLDAPFAGEPTALVTQLDVTALAQAGLTVAPGHLSVADGLPLPRDAEALAVLAGLVVLRD
jgi:tetratricopeptide (TPR) repeat protein